MNQLGSLGSGNGQFKSPYGIAVDSKGNIWVADMQNKQAEEFGQGGEYLTQFSAGTIQPAGVAAFGGHVWVAGIAVTGDQAQKWSYSE